MLLRELSLKNVGVFRGTHVFEFSVDEKKPVTLIGGKNGSGKTTVLESILLALYGSRARNFLGFLSYSEFLKNLTHHNQTHSHISLTFDRQELDANFQYQLERSWEVKSNGKINELLKVSIDGEPKAELAKNWPEYVEQILPESLAGLFIFDGEKIEALAEIETSTQALKGSLYGLLGLDLIDRLKTDLTDYRRRLTSSFSNKQETSDQIELQNAEASLNAAQTTFDSLNLELEKHEIVLEDTMRSYNDAKDKFSKSGGDVYESREVTVANLSEFKTRLELNKNKALEIASSDLPLLLVKKLLNRVSTIGKETTEAEEAAILLRHYKERDENFIASLSTNPLFNSEQVGLIEKFFTEDRSQYDSSYVPPFYVSTDSARKATDLAGLGGSDLIKQVENVLQEINACVVQVDAYENMLSFTPDSKELGSLIRELEATENAVKIAKLRSDDLADQVRHSENSLNDASRYFEKIATSALSSELATTREQRINREISNARGVLDSFEKKIITKNIDRIKSNIFAALGSLYRKKSLVSDIEIDPNTLEVTLKNSNGDVLSGDRLSAGERQLFATALLWGLSKATGHSLPTVVDTPVARLDSTHRQYLVENYFPRASHQIIILSTDEEIYGKYYETLKKSIGSKYLLEFDDDTGRTRIIDGYFE